MSDVKDAVKLDVITGPGRYETDRGFGVWIDGRTAGGNWAGRVDGADRGHLWRSDGTRVGGGREHRIVRRACLPPTLNADAEADAEARIASLEAENAALKEQLSERQADLTFFAGIIRRGGCRVMELERAIREHQANATVEDSFGQSYVDSKLWSVLGTGLGNAVHDDAKAMLRTMEGGAE